MTTSSAAPTATLCRALSLGAYATVGAVVEVARWVPRTVEHRRGQIDQRLTLARFIGEMAVRQATAEVRRRMATAPSSVPTDPATPHDEPAVATSAAPQTPPRGDVVRLVVSESVAAPLDGYDELAAAQIVGLLDHLDAEHLERVATYERQHRRRRTILHRVEQLLAVDS